MTAGAATPHDGSAVPRDGSWETLLGRVRTFPTLPIIVDRISELVSQPETTAKEIEAVVATDPTLTARLLQLVNSSFYAFPKRVTTISRAVGIIGFEALRNLAFSTSVIQLFKPNASGALGSFDPQAFWRHSIGTAIAAKEIARCLGEKQLEEFFVAGLVHDVGKLVHHEYITDQFAQACRIASERNILLRDAEQEVLRFTHDQTAGILLKHWRLPDRLIAMVTEHHTLPRGGDAGRDAAVVHLADILSRAKGFGSGGDDKIPRLQPRAWDALDLTFGHVEQVMQRMAEEFESATRLLTQ